MKTIGHAVLLTSSMATALAGCASEEAEQPTTPCTSEVAVEAVHDFAAAFNERRASDAEQLIADSDEFEWFADYPHRWTGYEPSQRSSLADYLSDRMSEGDRLEIVEVTAVQPDARRLVNFSMSVRKADGTAALGKGAVTCDGSIVVWLVGEPLST